MITNFQNHVFTIHDSIQLPTQMGGKIQFIVTNTKPSKPVIVTENTVFKLGSMTKVVDTSIPRITYDELGGLKNEVKKIREMVELPMRHPELFDKIGVEAPKGVLLYGPPGTGKTLLAKAVAGETNANFVSLSGPEIMAKHYGESEERLREIFTQAEENSPSIIFIDEIDSIAPKRDEVSGELEKRIVSQLLTLMDGMKSRGKVVVIAATNRPDSIDPATKKNLEDLIEK
jgi:ATP-dependent 26S proteasome regulatory subunit